MNRTVLLIVFAVLAVAFGWAYWPTLTTMVATWNDEPDYSHGFLVAPIAAYLLWLKREGLPELVEGVSWGGLVILLLGLGIRVAAGRFYIDSLDGWTIPLWIGGVVWFFCGRNVFLWAAPAIIFLWFMVPLPFRVEHALSRPLQAAAGALSTWMLQSLGQPALAEGNTITLGEHHLEVDQACSGLRMFMSFIALGVAYAMIVRRPLWQKLTVFAAVLPIALISNALRITATGLLYQYASSEWARAFSHDAAGWVMIPTAAAFLGALLWYLNKLVIEVETVPPKELVRRGERPAQA